jgi:hypothetical protein
MMQSILGVHLTIFVCLLTRQWKEMKIEGKRNAYLAVIMELTDSL